MSAVVSRPPTSPVVKFLFMATGVFAVAFLGAQATIRAADYYQSLQRPSWAPPAWLFGPVWTLLYGMMAVAAYLVWTAEDGRRRGALLLFWIQLAFNGLWSWIFFAWQKTMAAGIEIVILWALILATDVLFFRVRRAAGWLLFPYLGWVAFATALNWSVWSLNR